MDGTSAAASVIAVIQICASVFDLCRTYYTGVKDARKDITRLRNEVTRLESVLTSIADLADTDDSAKLSVLRTLVKPGGALSQCQNDLTGLLGKLQCSYDKEGMNRFGWRSLTWPLKSKDVDKSIAEIDRHKSLFYLALTTDAATLNMALSKSLDEVGEKLSATQLEVNATREGVMATFDLIKAMQEEANEEKKKQMIRDVTTWLTYTDPATSHQAAYRKRQPGTGQWLIDNVGFGEWKRSPGSFIWLKGIPGCGKTILASTVIENLKGDCEKDLKRILAYFYFEFNDADKQSPQKCLSSLTAQLCGGAEEIPTQLEDLYERCGTGRSPPSVNDLISIIDAFAALKSISDIYIVLDALDECRKTGSEDQRAQLLGAIKAAQSISPSNIHLLVTSRQEMDIEESIRPLLTVPALSIQDCGVSADIKEYIKSELASDLKLNRWSEDIKSEIERVLAEGAGGMYKLRFHMTQKSRLRNYHRFRWVFCQLDALKKSKKPSSILLALKQLPKTLDETYERMLLAIDEMYEEEAKRALMWLAFSERPLSVEEVAEAACVDPDADPPFKEDDRFQDPRNNILEILGSLVSLAPGDKIRLAHFSVKEYLLSTRLRTSQSADFAVSEMDAHLLCTRSCLAYVVREEEAPLRLCELPFITYACMYWPHHAQRVPEDDKRIRPWANVFYGSRPVYENWQSMLAPASPLPEVGTGGPQQKTLSPLCHASAMGFTSIVEELISQPEAIIAAGVEGGRWTALHTASMCGKKRTVSTILGLTKQTPIINAVSPEGTTALHLASSRGFGDVVSLLLRHGASTEIEDPKGELAIALAAASGHLSVVQLLLAENEATSDLSERHKGAALLSAIETDYISIIEKLLEYGASTETTNSNGLTPLLLATVSGRTQAARLLLKHGADPNRVDPLKSTPLHRAVQKGIDWAVELLIEHGADPTRRDSDGKTPFHYACARGSPFMVKKFLQRGVDVMLLDGWGKMPIHYVSWGWSAEAMQMLLDKGAQLEARTHRGETPLQLAAQRGGDSVVECLLRNGADITTCNKNGRTALHFAVIRGNREVLQVLLAHGADPRVKDIHGLTPIQAYDEYENKVAAGNTGYRITRCDS
ncbi:hypothetical protein DL762_001072 [Monosporascus cannonballus]|uniref:NACHT domain-containing protein n=1 Tax=Monosporascus cannonballus TaxID=155416 RepID=A0ABY0HKG6_9PEZI|nr:hypothetical protein DL762_001072 [Monosporascus cannonballus]